MGYIFQQSLHLQMINERIKEAETEIYSLQTSLAVVEEEERKKQSGMIAFLYDGMDALKRERTQVFAKLTEQEGRSPTRNNGPQSLGTLMNMAENHPLFYDVEDDSKKNV